MLLELIDSPRVSSHARRPPVTTASTTSLTVWFCSWRMAFSRASGTCSRATRRCSDTSPARGESAAGRLPRSASPASSPRAPPIPPTASPIAIAMPKALVTAPRRFSIALAGSLALSHSAPPTRSIDPGSGSGSHAVVEVTGGRRSASSSTCPRSTPSIPSTRARWVLLTSAKLPSSIPSTR